MTHRRQAAVDLTFDVLTADCLWFVEEIKLILLERSLYISYSRRLTCECMLLLSWAFTSGHHLDFT